MQAVGDFMVDLGASGNWDAGNNQFQLFDDGTNGDVASGDNIFAKTFVNPGVSNKVWKGVGDQGNFDFQFGGIGGGYTHSGNNAGVALNVPTGDIIFQIDATTGRIGIGAAGPQRPASIDTPAADSPLLKANYWQLYSN